MAGAFYGKQIHPHEGGTILDAANKAREEHSQTLLNKLQGEINSFNSLAQKHGHSMKLWWMPDQEMSSGRLVIGRKEQFEYNVYEAVLAYGLTEALPVAQGFRIYHCAEFGE